MHAAPRVTSGYIIQQEVTEAGRPLDYPVPSLRRLRCIIADPQGIEKRVIATHLELALSEGIIMSATLKLDEEYQSTRAALINARINMTDSIDALYRDWLRWRNKSRSLAGVDTVATANADRWWTLHLAQFRSLMDPLHVAARAERIRKDRNVVRTRLHPA